MDSRELADRARACGAVKSAVALAGWVSAGRQVTAKGVLRRADAAAAAQVLGVEIPQRIRSAADVPGLQHPWTAALAMGLLSVSGGRAVPGAELEHWRAAGDRDALAGWSLGLVAALADTFDDDGPEAVEIARIALTVLAADTPPTGADVARAIGCAVFESSLTLYRTFDRGFGHRDPAEVVLDLLATFGAVAGADGLWRITPLGRWAMRTLAARAGSSPTQVIDGTCQLKITLRYVRPACWRRVLVPSAATLGDLHEIIQIAFSWDDDHLHAFTVGRRRYGDPYFDFEADEGEITLAEVFTVARKPISYIYDFGDSWEHEIALERTVEPDSAVPHPVCVEGRGDAPVEDSGEEEVAWIPFDQTGINARLARLVGQR